MEDKMKKVMSILKWIIGGFIIILGFIALSIDEDGGTMTAFMFMLAGCFILPLESLNNVFSELFKGKKAPKRIIIGVLLVLGLVLMPPTNKENSQVVEETTTKTEEISVSRIEYYDLSNIESKENFFSNDLLFLSEKITLADNVNKVLKADGDLYLVNADLIKEGITDLDIVAKGTNYGGIIETYESSSLATERANELNTEESTDRIIVAECLVFRLPESTQDTFVTNIMNAIGSKAVVLEEVSDVANVEDKAVEEATELETSNKKIDSISDIDSLKYEGEAYVVINGNEPQFTETEKSNTSVFEVYSNLDSKGRCGVAFANVCKEIMPTEKRGSIGSVKPTGWHTVKYDNVDGKYLYNRCHLIGYQLAGENANAKNLITGTRYLNIKGMLPFENMVDDYVKETNNHVLYRVTPIFNGDNLVASGVQMEAWSVEDKGDGICFNVYCFNVQPGIEINYANGESKLSEVKETNPSSSESSKSNVSTQSAAASQDTNSQSVQATEATEATSKASQQVATGTTVYITATGKKYHRINNCGKTNPKNVEAISEQEAKDKGYEKCKKCW